MKNNMEAVIVDSPNGISDSVCQMFADRITEFYKDPENVKAAEKWIAERKKQ
jgi:hypothetical protein